MTERTTVTAEGTTLGEAIRLAAAELGVEPAAVSHKFDAEHFRNRYGGATGVDTVKIFAWVRDPAEFEGGEKARAWLAALLQEMGLPGEVRVNIRADQTANLTIDSEKARFLVGRQGSTIKSIRHLLAESVGRDYPDWTYHIDITGPEDREERSDDRDDRRGRDRGDRGDRRDRGDRGDRRDRGDRGDRGDRRDNKRSKEDAERLKALATKIAERVRDTGETEVIRKRLNSFERRVVHVAVSEIRGVQSESIEEDGEKRIAISRADGAGAGEE
ncbi:MAG: hypothetical protein H6742_17920 [Alphaproteobacteria bacterium]|nr:hypothetical protein [Alphaproteobacteria bacterium]